MRIVEEAELRERVREPAALAAVERAFRAVAEKRVVLPPPVHLPIPDAPGEVHIKSAYLVGSDTFAVKVASGFYGNPAKGLASGSGLMLLFDAATGFPLALLRDNGYLTDLRTGAAGALAARLLAPERIETVAVLGSGIQARFQLRALARVRQWRETRIWSPTRVHAVRCCDELEREIDARTTVAESAREAVRDADLVITVTPATEPLVEHAWLRRGATVIAVGSDGPGKRELALDVLLAADKVVVDSLAQSLRLGELQHAVAAGALERVAVHGELGEVLVGAKAGRERAEELIVCDLTGLGAQDAAIAAAAF